MQRKDDYHSRRQHLAGLSDSELEKRFWELTEQVVSPLVDLAEKNTSPSVERSVLLRMGLSSLEAKDLVEMVEKRGWLGKGAGQIVYVLAQTANCAVREAAQRLLQGSGWEDVAAHFEKEA